MFHSRAGAGSPTAAVLAPGVSRREAWSWALYDFANSGYTTVILTAVYSAYFVGVIADGAAWATFAWTCALSLSYLCVMLTLPKMGAWADARGTRRRLLFASTAGCIVATACLSTAGPGAVALALLFIALSNYCYCIGESAVASFLPQLARPEALGRLSGWGWGFGYFGGMLTLGMSLLLVTRATDAGQAVSEVVPWVVLLTCGVFALATLPAFLWLKERRPAPSEGSIAASDSGGGSDRIEASPVATATAKRRPMRQIWRDVGLHFPEFRAFLFCVACYQAGISVIITLAAVYAERAMGFTLPQIMMLVFLVNIAAAASALAFGHIQDRIGHRPALALTLVGWIVMVVLAHLATTPAVFWVAATVAGLCMGASQSAGRAMTGALAPRTRLGEFFALWSFAVQLAAVVGPLSYGIVTWVTGGNHRQAILVCGLFFVGGLLLLRRVDVVAGMRRQTSG